MLPIFYALTVIIIVLVFLIFWSYYRGTERSIKQLTLQLQETTQQLKIAQEAYYTHKMNQQVFEKILEDYKAQILEAQLKIKKIKEPKKADVGKRLEKLAARLKNPTKSQVHRLEKLLIESESQMGEVVFLQNKMLRHEIDERLFNRLSEEKQKKLIKTESEIRKMAKKQEEKTENQKETP